MLALVIDDSATTRHIIGSLLGQLGFQIEEASDGREGLERLGAMGLPSLVVVDWNMPELDGLAFVRRVRADPLYASMPLLMVTSVANKERIREALLAGASEYVMKPFTLDMLREKLDLLGISE